MERTTRYPNTLPVSPSKEERKSVDGDESVYDPLLVCSIANIFSLFPQVSEVLEFGGQFEYILVKVELINYEDSNMNDFGYFVLARDVHSKKYQLFQDYKKKMCNNQFNPKDLYYDLGEGRLDLKIGLTDVKCLCLGGGTITHTIQESLSTCRILIAGKHEIHGQGQHQITADVLRQKFSLYEKLQVIPQVN